MADENSKKPQGTEREFLHDLATPLAVALGQLEVLLDEGREAGTLSEAQQTRIGKVQKAMNRVKDLLETRRALLKGNVVPENK